MAKEIIFRVKDVVYYGKYFLLLEGKEIQQLDLENLQWELIVDNQIKENLNELKISTLYKDLKIEDTILEVDSNLSFLSRIKNNNVQVFLKRKKQKASISPTVRVSKESTAKNGEQILRFFLDEKISKL